MNLLKFYLLNHRLFIITLFVFITPTPPILWDVLCFACALCTRADSSTTLLATSLSWRVLTLFGDCVRLPLTDLTGLGLTCCSLWILPCLVWFPVLDPVIELSATRYTDPPSDDLSYGCHLCELALTTEDNLHQIAPREQTW